MIPRKIDAVSVFSNIDWVTVFLYLIVVTVGVISIYAASYDFDEAGIVIPFPQMDVHVDASAAPGTEK